MADSLVFLGRHPFGGSWLLVLRAALVLVSSTIFASSSWALPPEHREGGSAWDAGNLAEALDPANRGTRHPAEGARSAKTESTHYDMMDGQATYPDGTAIEHSVQGGQRWGYLYPTRITNPNGPGVVVKTAFK
jgi:hypothetical protein